MKDSQGTERGECEEDCLCVEYVKPKNDELKCNYCGHYPAKHKAKNVPVQKKEEKPKEELVSTPVQQKEEKTQIEKKEEQIVYTPSEVPKKKAPESTPAFAPASKPIKKKGLFEDLKNPAQFIKDKRKQKKA
eukprot:TRINITY_DN10677_c0_g1_i2.p1 TRINITY_DN10677_c0_g1~~TRINITY_DN10677_c0_g1_i2.p1  ORF type:complete len:132 (-),score=49.29 TRINITY_DN10677_c0_g1_i2:73-468(-)